jgi:SatD family (SatD)
MGNKKYLVIIGDIVQSRKITNRAVFQEHFEKQFKLMTLFDDNEIISPFTVTIGDEFQGVLSGARHLFQTINEIEYGLNLGLVYEHSREALEDAKKSYRLRYGIGIGTISTKINNNAAIGMDGPAFYHARESIERAKKDNLKFCFKSGMPGDEAINIMLRWLGYESRKWGWQKFQIIKLKKDGWTQKQIAESIGISQPAVSKTLKATPVGLSIETEQLIEKQMEAIVNEPKIVNYSMVAEIEQTYNPKS